MFMILSAATLRKLRPVDPFVERTVFNGNDDAAEYSGKYQNAGPGPQGSIYEI